MICYRFVVYDLAVDQAGQTLFSCSMDGSLILSYCKQCLQRKIKYICFGRYKKVFFQGEIKSWWLGGLRSGPPSCVNRAIQTVGLWQLWWQRWCLQGPVGDGVGGGMGGGEEAGQQETGPVTVRKLLFRDNSLFAGDEAGSLCRSQLNQGVSTNKEVKALTFISGGLPTWNWKTKWNTTLRSGAWLLTRLPR